MRRYTLTIRDKPFEVTVRRFTQEEAELEVNGTRYTVRVEQVDTVGEAPQPRTRPHPLPSGSPATPTPPTPSAGGEGAVTAPIPGLILEVFVEEGDAVTAGQPVLKMEAMKMETVISAPIEGRVAGIRVNRGDSVAQGQELMNIG